MIVAPFEPKPEAALVLLGHGSTLNPDSAGPTWQHADELRRRGAFGEIVCAFWKEEPSMREVFRMLDAPTVYVVPHFISEGYFTREVLPRELKLDGRCTRRDGKRIAYCDPVGLNPSMTRLLLKRAEEVAPGVPRDSIALVIAGHGTTLNENSAAAIRAQVELIRESGAGFAEVVDAYMEEPPLISRWAHMTSAPNVVVVPFFIADGLHSFEDIPVMLGIRDGGAEAPAGNAGPALTGRPHVIRGRNLYYSSAIGTDPLMADIILDQVRAFDVSRGFDEGAPAETRNDAPASGQPLSRRSGLSAELRRWLDAGGARMGEVIISRTVSGFELCHADDAEAGIDALERSNQPVTAREIARFDDASRFRPLKPAPTLRHRWRLDLPNVSALREALDYLYPAALGNRVRWKAGEAAPVPLRETLNRQTGIYRVAALIDDGTADEVICDVCRDGCLRRIAWTIDGHRRPRDVPPEKFQPDTPADEWPLVCLEACNWLVARMRSRMKSRLLAGQSTADEPNADRSTGPAAT